MEDFDVLLKRVDFGLVQTIGEMTVYKDRIKPVFNCVTMELEEDCNAVADDAIPKGIYTVVKRWSVKYKWHFHILNVPKRSFILIHNANYSFQLLGCIGVGKRIADINADGLKDVTDSKNTMKELLAILPDRFILKII